MTGKGVVVFLLIVIMAGCFIIPKFLQQRVEQDAVSAWASEMGTTEGDMLAYLTRATGIQDRDGLNSALIGKQANWSAFYTLNDPAFDDLVRRYHGADYDRNLKVRAALHRLVKHMSKARKAYLGGNRDAIDARIYGGMLQYLAGDAYSKLDDPTLFHPESPFLNNADVEIWVLVRRLVALFEGEVQRSSDLNRAFSGIRFDDTLRVIERMRHQPIIHELLIDLPSHHALGELFKALQEELPEL